MSEFTPQDSLGDESEVFSGETESRLHSAEHELIMKAALHEFSESGFHDARLENIARDSGISKRMIHYYYGDKKGLYIEALRYASILLRPTDEELEIIPDIPVESMRNLIEVLAECFFAHPEAARLLALENLIGILPKDTDLGLFGSSPMVLEIDRLLMHGQDYGAFRPGVSAIDIYLMISALSMFPVYNQYTFRSMYGVTITNSHNREGLKSLIKDSVIAFLTTTMPTSQGDSYTVTTAQMQMSSTPLEPDPYADSALRLSANGVPNRFDEEFALSDFYQDEYDD